VPGGLLCQEDELSLHTGSEFPSSSRPLSCCIGCHRSQFHWVAQEHHELTCLTDGSQTQS
jgi:hypothetical protein